jgi:hypothetical protein
MAAPGPTDAPTTTQPPPATTPVPPPATTPVPPPATTPVPPPTPGGVESTVEAKPEVSKKPVKLGKPSTTGTGLSGKVVSIKAMQAKARMPGEIQGPALAITVEVRNTRDKATDLSAVVVTLLDSDEAPGSEMSTDPAKPLAGKLAAGKSARGTYVFTVAKNKRKPITLSVSINDDPVLVFTGNAR